MEQELIVIAMATGYSIETWDYWPGASGMENLMATIFHTLRIYLYSFTVCFSPPTHESLAVNEADCMFSYVGVGAVLMCGR